MAVHSDSSRHAAEEAFLRLQGTQWLQNSAKSASCTSKRGETSPRTPSRTITWQCAMRPLWCHLTITSFVPGARLMQYGLSDHNAAKHRWYYFPKMQMDEMLLFKQFDSDTALPGRMTFHTAFVGPTVRPDAPERHSIECRAFLFFPDFEPTPVQLCLPIQWRRRCLSRRAWHVGPLEGPRVVRVDAKRRVHRSIRRTHVREFGYEVR